MPRCRPLLTGFDHRWRWFAVEIVRVVKVAHPHAVHEILGLWVREVVVLLDLPRVTFAHVKGLGEHFSSAST